MEKELFIALCDQLKNKVPELRWIDSDQGQLNVSERPPVAFPCCLVEMSYPQCTTHMAGKQRVRVRFQLQVAFNVWGTANASAPQESREKALQQYDTLQNIHKALQWWSFGRKINPTSRVSVLTENRSNALITPARVPDMGRNRNRTFESFVVYPGIVHFLVSGRDDDPPGRDHDRPDAVEQSSGLHEQ